MRFEKLVGPPPCVSFFPHSKLRAPNVSALTFAHSHSKENRQGISPYLSLVTLSLITCFVFFFSDAVLSLSIFCRHFVLIYFVLSHCLQLRAKLRSPFHLHPLDTERTLTPNVSATLTNLTKESWSRPSHRHKTQQQTARTHHGKRQVRF